MKDTGWNFEATYVELRDMFYDRGPINPVDKPELVLLNEPLAETLGLDIDALKEDVALLSGNRQTDTSFSQAYAGHQFGNFTMLGDGRALFLGEHVTANGKRVDVQLKGSGPTEYSRGGDGRAAIGPMVREYLISEAMHALGIPTNRALAVVATNEPVMRQGPKHGAVLTRVASSHLRVGTFQYAAAAGSIDDVIALADYAIHRHDPDLEGRPDRYEAFLGRVIERQAKLIADWQLVGFIHGVMNTDNTFISGEGLDYGPCAFMDSYHPHTVFSSIDREGRYAYANQPYIGSWNLARLAETLLPLLADTQEAAVDIANRLLNDYTEIYKQAYFTGLAHKIGLYVRKDDDDALTDELLRLMMETEADFTNTFRALTLGETESLPFASRDDGKAWLSAWRKRLAEQALPDEDVTRLMRQHNPAVIPRNHHVESAITSAERGDFGPTTALLDVLRKPYDYEADYGRYVSPGPERTYPYQTFCGT
ncbi:YdiU family protein [Exiguobacterium sp. SH0S1]|uniref:protein adenylyltransferase SelO n=1 Tax=Exiguobacterium sp. SH0S1 TaxID=2510949 RepID=UPI00103C8113|nr:YdiU family protein [Exiguobacterium sp. SH0S1]TCI79887.1 YdiU family protein [Exiguobacterium sp. SH0S1]